MKTVRPEIPICRESGGGGNRTRVRGRTGKSLYKLVLQFASPAGRLQATYRRASHPLEVPLRAIGSPSAAKPVVGAGFRPTGRRRSDVAT
jgi:hypothetical protein